MKIWNFICDGTPKEFSNLQSVAADSYSLSLKSTVKFASISRYAFTDAGIQLQKKVAF